MSSVILKPGKEKSVLQRHPWIFSGAISERPIHKPGEILGVHSFGGSFLGSAYFHPTNSIAGRMISFNDQNPYQALEEKLKESINLRQALMPHEEAKRLVNGEGDQIPGLIIDQYRDVLVIQIHTAGMDLLRDFILNFLVKTLNPKTIYEKSTGPSRYLEGLIECKQLLYGENLSEITIHEQGIPITVSFINSQKTGFFLDQRQMRKKVLELSKNRTVLNCFAYTGGFSLAALKGGALHVDSVEISQEACEMGRKNNFDLQRHHIIQEDVFHFLEKNTLSYDFVILDPPAFAKKRSDLVQACRGYKELHRKVFQKIPSHSVVLTSSCSSYMNQQLFQQVIFQAAYETKRNIRIIQRHEQALDHPVCLFHPEGDYLKSLLLYIQ